MKPLHLQREFGEGDLIRCATSENGITDPSMSSNQRVPYHGARKVFTKHVKWPNIRTWYVGQPASSTRPLEVGSPCSFSPVGGRLLKAPGALGTHIIVELSDCHPKVL